VPPFEPIPETAEALNNLDPSVDDGTLLSELIRLANRGQAIVPDLLGVSIARFDHGLTFTLLATARELAVLDAVQYATGGPCVEAAREEEVLEYAPDALDEERWRLFAQVTAARSVRSTLTLPVLSDARVVGTVNLYAGSQRAFVGHHDELAEVFGAWAAGAVTNADLSFMTRKEAEKAPERVEDQNLIDVATGIVAARLGVDVETAVARLRDAAVRAGVTLRHLARDIVNASQGPRREAE
jgi:GAF domain-containing protein